MIQRTSFKICLIAYPSALKAALYGLEDLFSVAGHLQRQHTRDMTPCFQVIFLLPEDAEKVCDTLLSEDPPDAIILPPSLTEPPAPDTFPSLLKLLRACHEKGTILGAVCAAISILAETGLLDGRQVAAHWSAAATMQQKFPALIIQPDRLLIDDGDLITVGGLMSWIDLGLCLIGRFLGPALMHETARYMLVTPPRQSQKPYRSFTPSLAHGDRAILKVQHFLNTHSGSRVTIPIMAACSGLTERTFLRRFRKATTMTPLEYLHHLRVEKGRTLLETTTLSFQQIAWAVGYQDSQAFRKIFIRLTGTGPAAYRRENAPL